MRITDKGQVTIPVQIREKLGLLPRVEVEFVLDGDTVRLVRAETGKKESRGERAVRLLRGKGRYPARTTDELMKLLRGG